MSTYIYLVCKDHQPNIRADGESGQHTYDIPQIRDDIANMDVILAARAIDMVFDDTEWMRNNTAHFLADHGKCYFVIEDQYGVEYETGIPDSEELIRKAADDLEAKTRRLQGILNKEVAALRVRIQNVRQEEIIGELLNKLEVPVAESRTDAPPTGRRPEPR